MAYHFSRNSGWRTWASPNSSRTVRCCRVKSECSRHSQRASRSSSSPTASRSSMAWVVLTMAARDTSILAIATPSPRSTRRRSTRTRRTTGTGCRRCPRPARHPVRRELTGTAQSARPAHCAGFRRAASCTGNTPHRAFRVRGPQRPSRRSRCARHRRTGCRCARHRG
jgi:hypothetical protein